MPVLPVRVTSTAQYKAISTPPLSMARPLLPPTHAELAIEDQDKTIGAGADRPTYVTRDPRIRAVSNTGAENSASLASAGKPSTAPRNNSLLAKPPLLAIKIRTPNAASNSKLFSSSINASKSASPAAPQSNSDMSISTSGSVNPTSAQPTSTRFLPARQSTEPLPGTGKSAETAVSSTIVMSSAHGNQMLQSSSALPVAGPSAKPATPPVSATAKMPMPAFGQPAFALPPAAVGTLARSESSQHGKAPPTLGSTSARSPPARALSSSGVTSVATKDVSAPSEAEKRAKSKRLFFDMQKTLNLERTKHAEGLDAIKKRYAKDLEAAQMKHAQQLTAAKEEHAQKLAEAQVQRAEEVRALQTQRIELEKAVKNAEKAVAAMKQQVADISQQAEMKAAELRKTYKRQLIEKVAKTRQELERARRDADARGQEVVGMKRKSVEIAGRLVRMRTEDATSPVREPAEQDEGDIINTVSSFESYIEGLRSMLQSEISSRQALERELRILKDVDRENKEPFVVPALLEAFVRLAKLGEGSEDGRR
ncbi:hypothetical protein EWM64_g743 [Hericium alpestre]|uniref:Uncharacterized protein n=1 Tax=Hericium alpestre TaxID=135208 RepID=A0A4Z0ACA0_9AGAM|nr:hypothetical protein EWM64_g743 [Hericium alpestre]